MKETITREAPFYGFTLLALAEGVAKLNLGCHTLWFVLGGLTLHTAVTIAKMFKLSKSA